MAKTCGVILAGGVGTRFWPRSREKFPKHLLQIVGKDTMIQNTVKRLDPLVLPRETFVVTNRLQKSHVMKQLPQIPEENVIVEPVGRDTAPCIGLAALHVRRTNPDAVMVVLPADHIIRDGGEFHRALNLAIDTARESSSLLTIGITPTHPETGYGYLLLGPTPLLAHANAVGYFVMVAILVVFGGMLEELVFRGLVQSAAVRVFGGTGAGVIFTAALGTALYWGSGSIPYLFLMALVGCAFGLALLRGASLWGIALSHGLMLVTMAFLAQGLARQV